MLPLIARFKVREPGRRGVRLWFPVIVIWALLAALMILALPFLLLGALVTAGRGPGWRLLLVYPLVASVLWHLGGLTVDVEQRRKDSAFLIEFV
jgi:hypothetical protein